MRLRHLTLALTMLAALAFTATACDKKAEDAKAGGDKAAAGDKAKTGGDKAKADKPKADKAKADKPEPKPEPKVELVDIDITAALAKAGREATTKVTVKAPKGAKATESYGDVEVVAGKTFALVVTTEAEDLAKDKAFHEKNTVQKHKGFVVDKPDGFISKAEVMRRVSHFMTGNQKAGEETFGCKSKRGAVSFTEGQAKAMLAACHTISAK